MKIQTARLLVALIEEQREGLSRLERTHFEAAIAYLEQGDVRLSLAKMHLAQFARSLRPTADPISSASNTEHAADLGAADLAAKARQLLKDLQ